jgi:putative ABC transport system substrate-binding protein
MRRRGFITLVSGGAAALGSGRVGHAQSGQTRRVGILAPGPLTPIERLKDRLRDHGWVIGKTIQFEERWGGDDDLSYQKLAAELAAIPVDAIVTWSTPAVLAAKRATTRIPIVMGAIADPVGVGAVTNLARPGGNVTGFSTQNFELEEKRLELLRELVPSANRIVALGNANNLYVTNAAARLTKVAAAARLEFEAILADISNGLDEMFSRVKAFQPKAVIVISSPALFPHRAKVVEFITSNRLPAIYPFPEFAEAGGLMAYATNYDELFRQAADYVDKILRGAVAGDLPVQQAASFRFIVSLKAAQAIGLTLPMAFVSRATEVLD